MKRAAAKKEDKITIEKIKGVIPKNKRMDWYQRRIRVVSPYFTWLFLRIGLNANQVTLLSILPVVFGSFLLLSKDPLYWILAWAIMQLYCIMDCSDGEVARYRNELTEFGFVVDEFLHPISNVLVLTFAMFGLFFAYQNFYALAFGLSAIIFTLFNRLLKLSFSVRDKDILQKHVGGGKVQLGGLTHIIPVMAVLEVVRPDSGFLILGMIGIITPMVFLRNLVRAYESKQ